MADTQPDEQMPLKKKEVSDIGRLAHIAITNYYGNSLNDQQRVDRFNDLRAFQLLLEANFDQGEQVNLQRFLDSSVERRSKEEALKYYETRMDTVDLEFVYNQFLKHLKRLELRRK